MKRALLLFSVLLIGISAVTAQTSSQTRKQIREARKEFRKAQKEARKATEAAENSMLFQQAVEALKNRDFVLEANRVEFKRGSFAYVTSSTNFVSMHNDRATIQLALSKMISGPNGLGGITVEGTVSDVQMSTDRQGNIHYSMMVQGAVVSANVTFTLVNGSNKCSVTVNPNFNSNRITFVGELYPGDRSTIFKGRSI